MTCWAATAPAAAFIADWLRCCWRAMDLPMYSIAMFLILSALWLGNCARNLFSSSLSWAPMFAGICTCGVNCVGRGDPAPMLGMLSPTPTPGDDIPPPLAALKAAIITAGLLAR